MIKLKIYILLLLTVVASLVACKQQDSIQQFIISQQETGDIISFDIPASVLGVKKNELTREEQKTLKSIKKANILALKVTESNKEKYFSDKKRIKNIFKQNTYSELMRFGKNVKGAKVYMMGDENSVDELLIFANDDTKGWLLLRILGDNMQPDKILKLFKNLDIDLNNLDLSPLKGMFDDKDS